MDTKIPKIGLDELYVTVLESRRVRDEQGREWMENCPKSLPRTGSVILDAVAEVLAKTTYLEFGSVARALGVDPIDLRGVIRILTGMKPLDLIQAYRLRQAKEWLMCTDLTPVEIATRCGFGTKGSFQHFFRKQTGQTPSKFRRRKRPENFRYLYTWK